jgi:uncharacterized protein (DUF885 family)
MKSCRCSAPAKWEKSIARDSRLNRDVAIKVLPEAFVHDAERLADEELWRARRLVVDTGMHAKRCTREQAIDCGIEASEVERYVVMPGQACSYMIGQLKLLELRERAKTRLKDRLSERAFHNAVLAPGAVPLELLEQEVDRFIRR